MSKRNSNTSAQQATIAQVVSGGQTGVDRAALDAAIETGIPIGGWCPRGRRSERGLIPRCYPLKETTARSYAVRTEWNVRDSDGTLIIVLHEVSKGTRLTLNFAKELKKPATVVHLRPPDSENLFSDQKSLNQEIDSVVQWLCDHRIRVLNVAGPRGSSHKDVYPESKQFMHLLLQRTQMSESSAI